MSTQFHSAMKAIIAMPYRKNEAAKSAKSKHGHEDSIAEVLELNEFVAIDKKDLPKFKKEFLNQWEETNFQPIGFLEEKTDKEYKREFWKTKRFKQMPRGSFVQQPCGSHSFPDFLIRDFDGRFIPLEAKSGKKQDGKDQKDDATTSAPMWNDNLPKHGAIYVYSNEKNNKTTVALGEDIIDKEVIEIRKEMDREHAQWLERYNAQIRAADKKRRGWAPGYRPQNFQVGGMEFTDWFNHADRQTCESNVLSFAASL